MIEISSEALIPISEVPAALPRRVSIASVYRWMLRGVKGIHLQTILIGGRRYTSREALQRFAEQTTAAASGERPPVRTFTRRARDQAKAREELKAVGF